MLKDIDRSNKAPVLAGSFKLKFAVLFEGILSSFIMSGNTGVFIPNEEDFPKGAFPHDPYPFKMFPQ